MVVIQKKKNKKNKCKSPLQTKDLELREDPESKMYRVISQSEDSIRVTRSYYDQSEANITVVRR